MIDQYGKLQELEAQMAIATEQLEREQKFAAEAELRFEKNLAAFKRYYPKIAKAIDEFSSAEPLEIFVTETGAANIRERSTGVAMYGKDPIAQTEKQVEQALAKPICTHMSFHSYASVPDDDQRLHAQFMKRLGAATVAAGDYEPPISIGDRFPTLIMFGIGLGYQVPILLKRVIFDYIYIVEPNFEHFYSSLFAIDWSEVIEQVEAHKGCFAFHIGSSYANFVDDIYSVSQDLGAFSLTKCFCYQHIVSRETNDLIRTFKERLFEIHGGYGFYNDATTAIAHTVKNCERGVNLLKLGSENRHQYSEFPVFVVGNGPSLDETLGFIRENQDKAIIIAAGTALQTLLKNDIQPDFHALVERPKITYDVLVQTLPVEAYKKLNLLTLSLMYPDVAPLYKWCGMAGKGIDAGGDLLNYTLLNEQGHRLRYLQACNPLVSNTALSYAVNLGFKQIYMFGVDNGYTADGKHHAAASDYYKGKLTNWKPFKAEHTLKGNFGGVVKSSGFLAMSARQMGRLLSIETFKDVECYNVGEGAYVEHTRPLHAEHLLPEFFKIDKNDVIEFVKSEKFSEFQFKQFEQYLQLDEYDRICDHLIELSSEAINSRAEALDNLRRQSRFLYSHRGTRVSHLHYVLEGELLYFHCPLITLLYTKRDEQQALLDFKRGHEVWRDFIIAARENFKTAWLKKCEMGWSPDN